MAISPIRKKDKVLVLAGKDRGKQGEVIEVDRVKGRVLVAKVNMVKKHAKGKPPQKPGGIQEKEAYLADRQSDVGLPEMQQGDAVQKSAPFPTAPKPASAATAAK